MNKDLEEALSDKAFREFVETTVFSTQSFDQKINALLDHSKMGKKLAMLLLSVLGEMLENYAFHYYKTYQPGQSFEQYYRRNQTNFENFLSFELKKMASEQDDLYVLMGADFIKNLMSDRKKLMEGAFELIKRSSDAPGSSPSSNDLIRQKFLSNLKRLLSDTKTNDQQKLDLIQNMTGETKEYNVRCQLLRGQINQYRQEHTEPNPRHRPNTSRLLTFLGKDYGLHNNLTLLLNRVMAEELEESVTDDLSSSSRTEIGEPMVHHYEAYSSEEFSDFESDDDQENVQAGPSSTGPR